MRLALVLLPRAVIRSPASDLESTGSLKVLSLRIRGSGGLFPRPLRSNSGKGNVELWLMSAQEYVATRILLPMVGP